MAEVAAPPDMEKRVRQYIEVRDALERLDEKQKAERKPLQEVQDLLAGVIQKFLDDHSLEGLKTDAGTCYVSVRHTATVADPDAFINFVISTKDFDLLERRASATAVRAYVAEHGTLPTGVNLHALASVGVRRPTKGKKS